MPLHPEGAQPKIPEISVRNQMERTISIRSIWDHLSRWSTSTGQATSVGRTEMSPQVPFDKIVVPSTALLYPAYKNNNQTRGGLGRVCATGMYRCIGRVEFPKFQIGVFAKWKAPPICLKWTVKFLHSTRTTNMMILIYITERRIYL